ncbi:hypothetical protein [Caldisalinibacter kiritimatiensis]|uniref:Uncharacterized protein n=1 Tax=Caldisalinibacter kiritimatiensis TaxID=1304284 RepID=R1CDK8_9FIRM|nr:hypothetical protein [Caldisalinibacter kiritimatiensis]EOD00375.1 hypothetical protein L21TH_1579 [Caldisalinibacter kiritimatiensis]
MDNNEEYLKEKLEWVKYRLEMLDIIEDKLKEMKSLAEYIKENDLDDEEAMKINNKFNELKEEVIKMDNKSKKFWSDNQ